MEIRSIETAFQENDNVIEGYAIRFNCTSNVLYDKPVGGINLVHT